MTLVVMVRVPITTNANTSILLCFRGVCCAMIGEWLQPHGS